MTRSMGHGKHSLQLSRRDQVSFAPNEGLALACPLVLALALALVLALLFELMLVLMPALMPALMMAPVR